MLGAIAGDIIGSPYERNNTGKYNFPLFRFREPISRFTDDTVLTVAVADALLHGKDYMPTYRDYYRRYKNRGFGKGFRSWASVDDQEFGDSFGNGSAMRVSPVGWYCQSLSDVLAEAEKSALPSHSHPEGIKGAQAIAACIFLARTGSGKQRIKNYVEAEFGYDLSKTVPELLEEFHFASCQGSVGPAIQAFLDSDNFEDAIRRAVIQGGDSDTIAAMAGSIAEAYYGGVPITIRAFAMMYMPYNFRRVIGEFTKKYIVYNRK